MASQFVYNTASIAKILTPSLITRALLESKIAKFFARLDSSALDSLSSRLVRRGNERPYAASPEAFCTISLARIQNISQASPRRRLRRRTSLCAARRSGASGTKTTSSVGRIR